MKPLLHWRRRQPLVVFFSLRGILVGFHGDHHWMVSWGGVGWGGGGGRGLAVAVGVGGGGWWPLKIKRSGAFQQLWLVPYR